MTDTTLAVIFVCIGIVALLFIGVALSVKGDDYDHR